MKNYPSADEDYTLWMLIVQTRTAMLKVRQKELDQYRISARHCGTLGIIHNSDGSTTISEIRRWLLMEKHSISELLGRMERKGLIRKFKDSTKKNIVRVALMEKGHTAYNHAAKRESIYKLMSCLSKEEHRQLRSCLEKLLGKAMQELGMEHKDFFAEGYHRPLSKCDEGTM